MQLPSNLAGTAALVLALSAWVAVTFAVSARVESKSFEQKTRWPGPALAGALGAVACAAYLATGEAVCAATACIALLAVAPADARVGFVFDAVTGPAVAVSILLRGLSGTLHDATTGALALTGVFGGIWLCSRGRWLGFGDVKALFLIGIAFGPFRALLVVLLASLSALGVAAFQRRIEGGRALPFAPHLAAASLAALLAGTQFEKWLGVSS